MTPPALEARAAPPAADFRLQRRAGVGYIAVGAAAAAALWFACDRLLPPPLGMESLSTRMVFALQCACASVLLAFVPGVEAVAHERLGSPAFDPLSGFETRRLRVNLRYLQNTLEQIVVFVAALFGLAALCATGSEMRAVEATTVVWIAARFAFWIGYHQSAAMRGLGASGMILSMAALIYVVARFGYDLAGPAGAAAPIVLFAAIEAVLFWSTRPLAVEPPG